MKFVSYDFGSFRFVAPAHLQTSDSPPTAISKLPDFQTPPINAIYNYSTSLQKVLNGRILLLQEIPFPLEDIHEHYKNGYVKYHKAIIEKNNSYFCRRCGNEKRHLFAKHACARCEEDCVYCSHCIMMGKVSQCTPLLTWSGPTIDYGNRVRTLEWQGTLSAGQEHASSKIVAAVGTPRKILIWAVCGAGKTEILFEGINKAIEHGQTVLIATPRSDVVHELTPRIKAVFQNVSVLSLYGGSEDRGKEGQLVIATTHQLLRYENHFDFVVIDEVDAFPFSFDPMLKYAANKAAKSSATTILLTATPDKKLQKSSELEIVKIPKRFHGYPLPVPRPKWSGNWRKLLKKKQVPGTIINWLTERVAKQQQTFLFVPSVIVLDQLVPILQRSFERLDGVHAEDPNRREKVQKFRNNEIQLLVTTTILERGVTVPNVAVAVYGADDDVFTESALVQISGRVGRSAQFPSGDIIFFHYGQTEAMLDAIDHIILMNKLGGF
jgi:competence protein ComFA